LAQQTVMARVLKGEELNSAHLIFPTLSCAVLTALALWTVVRALKGMAIKA
jgi:hypothetical protein